MEKLYKLKLPIIKLIFIIVYLINQISSYVILPLDYLPSKYYQFIQDGNQLESEEQIIKILYFSKLITFLDIGSPSKTQMLLLDSENKDFYLDSYNPSNNAQEKNKLSNIYKFERNDYYNESFSISYIKGKSEYYEYEIDEYSEIYYSKDKLKLNYYGNNVYIEDFPIKIIKNNIGNIPGTIGLSMNKAFSKDIKSFLYQLKSKNLIKDYYWFFDFDEISPIDKKVKGRLVIGDLPHNIFPKKYSKENYDQMTSCIYTSFWTISIDEIYIENTNKDYQFINTDISLFYDFYPAIGPRKFLDDIKTNFLQELLDTNKCFNGTFSQNIYFSIYSPDDLIFYYCEKSVKNILCENLPSIKFIKNDYVFELNKEELFFIKDDYIYFMVLFLKDYYFTENYNHNYNFFVGQIFTSKYHFVFHTEDNQIGFYEKINKEEEKENLINNNKYNSLNHSIIIIFLFIISLFIGISLTKKFNDKTERNRKEKGNELIELDEYNSS